MLSSTRCCRLNLRFSAPHTTHLEQGTCSHRRGENHGLTHIDLLKVDTEGADWQVLRGFESVLSRRGISVVQFEYGYACILARTLHIDFCEYLQRNGYVIGNPPVAQRMAILATGLLVSFFPDGTFTRGIPTRGFTDSISDSPVRSSSSKGCPFIMRNTLRDHDEAGLLSSGKSPAALNRLWAGRHPSGDCDPARAKLRVGTGPGTARTQECLCHTKGYL